MVCIRPYVPKEPRQGGNGTNFTPGSSFLIAPREDFGTHEWRDWLMAGLGAESFSKVMLSGFVCGDSTNKAAGVIPAYAGTTPG